MCLHINVSMYGRRYNIIAHRIFLCILYVINWQILYMIITHSMQTYATQFVKQGNVIPMWFIKTAKHEEDADSWSLLVHITTCTATKSPWISLVADLPMECCAVCPSSAGMQEGEEKPIFEWPKLNVLLSINPVCQLQFLVCLTL